MKITRISVIIVLLSIVALTSCTEKIKSEKQDLTHFVSPMVGTDDHGHTFPGAVMPFGMVQLSPDTRLDGWDGCSGYHYSDSVIFGFSHTHLSGTGCSDYGDILLMPMQGRYSLENGAKDIDNSDYYSSKFSHENEVALPGYYSVNLKDDNIDVELTVSPRVGMHRYKYNGEGKKYVILDLEHRDIVLESSLKKISDTRYVGMRRSRAWAADQHLYFTIDFSSPVKIIDTRRNSQQESFNDLEYVDEYDTQTAVFAFEVVDDDASELMVKVAISQVDIEGSTKNLEAEIPSWDFDSIRQTADEAWNEELNKIIVKGCDYDKEVFYTSLYHSFIHPTLAQDVDGRYRGTDLEIHSAKDFTYYTVFSLWDTFRAAHPLYTIVQQKRTLDFVKTFLTEYLQGGKLPMWELSSNYTGCMIGYNAVPPMVDAYTKGIYDEDLKALALEAMISTATADELGKHDYMKYGFLPVESEHESVSKTLEYGFDDWCIAQYAKAIGNEEVYKEYIIRSQAYKNLFNREHGLMVPRMNGSWKTDFDGKEVDFNFTEANSWQYSFFVPHDILTLIDMYGGNENFEAKLDALFSEGSETYGKDQKDISGMIGQYAHGNEPSHHMAYLYNYCGKPAKTQEKVRQIMSELYKTTPAGFCGNEDCGQMSSWYVLSSVGIYPVNPGNGIFDFGSPIFDTVIFNLENGKTFAMIAHNNSKENIYIEKVKLNGKTYSKSYISYSEIANGGRIDIYMTSDANNGWGTKAESIYPSRVTDYLVATVPFTNTPARTFFDSMNVELSSYDEGAQIYYSVNDGEYKLYDGPFEITETSEIKAYCHREGYIDSKPIVSKYVKRHADRKITLYNQYSRMYSAGGDDALIDCLRGGNDFRSGEWQGYQGQDFTAVVDLCSERDINKIETGFIQDTRSWIVFPQYVEYYVSDDGANFKKVAKVTHDIPANDYTQQIYNFTCELNCKARYVKVFAKYFGTLPKWHLGYGGESFIFMDEIVIE